MLRKLVQYLTNLGSPRRFYYLCGRIWPCALIISLFALGYGAVGGLWLAPPDAQQGETFRIIYVHVPCAFLSMMLYVAVAIGSAVYLIWRIKIAQIVAFCAAPIGAFFTICALITGSIWGKPMWGTWWIWDARLTSELILLFIYIGYMGLNHAINNPKSAAKISSIFAIMGMIDIPIIHYSVYWWNTLHQGATITRWGKPAIEMSMLIPLLSMLLGFTLYTVCLICIRIRSEILEREKSKYWVAALVKKEA